MRRFCRLLLSHYLVIINITHLPRIVLSLLRDETTTFVFPAVPKIIPSLSQSTTIVSMSMTTQKKKVPLYSFDEARKMARNHGFESQQEFLSYECPGAYQVPKNPHELYKEQWKGWDDFLGICWNFEKARDIARTIPNISTQQEYLHLFTANNDKSSAVKDDNHPASRLPYRPDLKYKTEWLGWDDWLLPCK